MFSSLFALLIAEMCLRKLRAGCGRTADLLIGLRVLESAGRYAFCMYLVGNCVFGIA